MLFFSGYLQYPLKIKDWTHNKFLLKVYPKISIKWLSKSENNIYNSYLVYKLIRFNLFSMFSYKI